MFHTTILLVKVHARMSDQYVLREKQRTEEKRGRDRGCGCCSERELQSDNFIEGRVRVIEVEEGEFKPSRLPMTKFPQRHNHQPTTPLILPISTLHWTISTIKDVARHNYRRVQQRGPFHLTKTFLYFAIITNGSEKRS
jgi:hypothetical protein